MNDLPDAHRDVVEALFLGAGTVALEKLQGGFSGALVVKAKPAAGSSVVVKLDTSPEDITTETRNMELYAKDLGGNAPRLLRHVVRGKAAGLVIELCGAAWTLPGLRVKQRIRTFKDLFEEHDTQVIPVLHNVFGTILPHLTLKKPVERVEGGSLAQAYALKHVFDKHVFEREKTVRKILDKWDNKHGDRAAFERSIALDIDERHRPGGMHDGESVEAYFMRTAPAQGRK